MNRRGFSAEKRIQPSLPSLSDQQSAKIPYDPVAQSAEHLPFKQGVRGSNPRWVTRTNSLHDCLIVQAILFFVNFLMVLDELYGEENFVSARAYLCRFCTCHFSSCQAVQMHLCTAYQQFCVAIFMHLADCMHFPALYTQSYITREFCGCRCPKSY